nr:sugar-binding domain-containing protein [Kineococcus siccus]
MAEGLRTRFGVPAAFVLRAEGETVLDQRRAVGVFTAGLLQEVLAPEDVVGLAWGRAVSVVAAAVHAPLRCRFVQLSGALPRPDVEESAVELVRRVAAGTSSTAVTFYAPLAVADAATADSLRAQSGIAEALAEHDHLTKAVVSIGAWAPGESTALDSLDPADAHALAAAGAVAEITGVLLAADGGPVPGLAARVIGITADQLRRTPDVVAMATGDAGARAAAVAAVLRSGLVSALVTHAELARQVLALPDPPPR